MPRAPRRVPRGLHGWNGRGGGARNSQDPRPGAGARRTTEGSRRAVRTAPFEGDQEAPSDRGVSQERQQTRVDDPVRCACASARAASDGAAGRGTVCDERLERSVPSRHQPEQPTQALDRLAGTRDHHSQREADAARSGRRADRQWAPRTPRRRQPQPQAQVTFGPAAREARAVSAKPARQAGRLQRPLGHHSRARTQTKRVRTAPAHGPRAVQAVRHEQAGSQWVRSQHQERQALGGEGPTGGLGHLGRGSQDSTSDAEPRADSASPGHPSVQPGLGGRRLHQGAPPGLLCLQCRLRRGSNGCARAVVTRRGHGSQPNHAQFAQHARAKLGRTNRSPHAGHRAWMLLHDHREGRSQGNRTTVHELRGRPTGIRAGADRPTRAHQSPSNRRDPPGWIGQGKQRKQDHARTSQRQRRDEQVGLAGDHGRTHHLQ